MSSRKIVVGALTIVVVLAGYVLSANTQVNLDHLKQQVEQQYQRKLREQQPSPPAPQQAPPSAPAQDFNALRAQVQQLQERVLKLEQEVQDMRRPKIMPVNNH